MAIGNLLPGLGHPSNLAPKEIRQAGSRSGSSPRETVLGVRRGDASGASEQGFHGEVRMTWGQTWGQVLI